MPYLTHRLAIGMHMDINVFGYSRYAGAKIRDETNMLDFQLHDKWWPSVIKSSKEKNLLEDVF